MNLEPTVVPERRAGPEDRRQPSVVETILVKSLAAIIVVGLTCAAALFGFGLVINEIQQQRFDALVMNCEETNKRNTNVNAQISQAVAVIPTGPRRSRAEKSAGPFRLILNAAVPYTKDCHAYARERVKGYL